MFQNQSRNSAILTQCKNQLGKWKNISVFTIIGLLTVSGFLVYEVVKDKEKIYTFNPTIDGKMSEDEHWELAHNIHTSYLQVDDNNTDAYNYIYTYIDDDYLYILVDLCSDTSNDIDGEWINLYIDVNQSRDLYEFENSTFYYNDQGELIDDYVLYIGEIMDDYIENTLENQLQEVISYNTSSNQKYTNFTFGGLDGDDIGNALINSSVNYSVAVGFDNSLNSNITHRIYEFNITIDDLGKYFDPENFGIMIQGYGTAAISIDKLTEMGNFYCMPNDGLSIFYTTLWGNIIQVYFDGGYAANLNTTLVQVISMLLLSSQEYYFYPCGTNTTTPNLDYNAYEYQEDT